MTGRADWHTAWIVAIVDVRTLLIYAVDSLLSDGESRMADRGESSSSGRSSPATRDRSRSPARRSRSVSPRRITRATPQRVGGGAVAVVTDTVAVGTVAASRGQIPTHLVRRMMTLTEKDSELADFLSKHKRADDKPVTCSLNQWSS